MLPVESNEMAYFCFQQNNSLEYRHANSNWNVMIAIAERSIVNGPWVKEPQKPEGGFMELKFVERLIRHLLDNWGSEPFLSTWNSMGKQRNERTWNVLGLKSKVLESENVE